VQIMATGAPDVNHVISVQPGQALMLFYKDVGPLVSYEWAMAQGLAGQPVYAVEVVFIGKR
jgi:hypothetical protein